MKKRIISFMLVLLMLLSVAGCGNDPDEGGETNSSVESVESNVDVSGDLSNGSSDVSDTAIDVSSYINADGTITMPDLVNMSEAEAKQLLDALGLKYKSTQTYYSEDIAVGNIIKSDYVAGEIVKKGTQIFLTIRKEGVYSDPSVPFVDPLVAAREKLSQGGNSDYIPLNYDIMKAVWISQFDLEGVLAAGAQVTEETLRKYFGNLCKKLADDGYNTVIVQVRPYGDSFYPSEYYPWSKYAVGSYGLYGNYDPLKVMIEEAHKYSLSFQAWINPMRAFANEKTFEIINVNYPLRQWYDNPKKYPNWVYFYKSYYYLNIAYEEVRQLIIDGATEIVRYYDVDGVHMDDYFYPTGIPNAFDQVMFRKSGALTLTRFRQDNVNKLVSGLYSAIKKENKNVLFGISPAGNINNVRNSCCVDIDTILANKGYVDYIMPQIYWGFEHPTQPYATCMANWQKLIKEDSIKFIVGITTSNIAAPSGEFVTRKDVFKRYLQHAQSTDKFDGICIFSVSNLYSMYTAERSQNENVIKEMRYFLPVFKKLESNKIIY